MINRKKFIKPKLQPHDIIKQHRQPYPARSLSVDAEFKNMSICYPLLSTLNVISVFDRNTLGHVVDFVNTNKTRGKFELPCISFENQEHRANRLTILLRNEITMN